ncbi:MAG: triphosphoribosyl-dephospho-CoA synthase [Pirellulales bacterium]
MGGIDLDPTQKPGQRVRPHSVGTCATLACLWEATAAKPGNVYRGADFVDLTYADFLVSAAVIGPYLENARERGVGATILAAVRATRTAIGTNTNLGTILLLAPLAVVPITQPLATGLGGVLMRLNEADTRDTYEAIRFAQPGGLGEVDEADVHKKPVPSMNLIEAMRLAMDRDCVARQYVNGFQQVFRTAERVFTNTKSGLPLGESIVHAFMQLLSEMPDSLIARKCGLSTAMSVTVRAAKIMDQWETRSTDYRDAVGEFDFYLRSDGHRLNPGTTADIMAAALFVLLREQRIDWPVKFYG